MVIISWVEAGAWKAVVGSANEPVSGSGLAEDDVGLVVGRPGHGGGGVHFGRDYPRGKLWSQMRPMYRDEPVSENSPKLASPAALGLSAAGSGSMGDTLRGMS